MLTIEETQAAEVKAAKKEAKRLAALALANAANDDDDDDDDTTPAGTIAGPVTSYDGALNARSFASPNATGAESAPMRAYVFAQDSQGQPKLIGGTWIGGAIVSDKYQPLKDSNGAELATQPDYVGREKTIKFVITDNATGNEYRLSGSAFEAAYKAIGQKMTFAAREMSQVVAEVGGYSRATVILA